MWFERESLAELVPATGQKRLFPLAAFLASAVLAQNAFAVPINDGDELVTDSNLTIGTTTSPYTVVIGLEDSITVNDSVTSDKFMVGTETYIDSNGLNANGKKITNVADGDISSAGSKDAVNGGQLFATNQNVDANASDITDNAGDISTNASDISANAGDIGTNASNISTNSGQYHYPAK